MAQKVVATTASNAFLCPVVNSQLGRISLRIERLDTNLHMRLNTPPNNNLMPKIHQHRAPQKTNDR